jgi:hypothetical protein
MSDEVNHYLAADHWAGCRAMTNLMASLSRRSFTLLAADRRTDNVYQADFDASGKHFPLTGRARLPERLLSRA